MIEGLTTDTIVMAAITVILAVAGPFIAKQRGTINELRYLLMAISGALEDGKITEKEVRVIIAAAKPLLMKHKIGIPQPKFPKGGPDND